MLISCKIILYIYIYIFKNKISWRSLVFCSLPGNETSPESFLLHNALARKPKRIRTAFSPSQLLRLEHAFEKNHYVVGAERKQLAHSLSLTETQVRNTIYSSVLKFTSYFLPHEQCAHFILKCTPSSQCVCVCVCVLFWLLQTCLHFTVLFIVIPKRHFSHYGCCRGLHVIFFIACFPLTWHVRHGAF